MTFAAGFLLLIWVVVSILANGIALLHSLTKLRGLELFGYGAAAGVLLHGILGCAIAAAPGVRWAFVAILALGVPPNQLCLDSALQPVLPGVPNDVFGLPF
jgi:hypothetical protein